MWDEIENRQPIAPTPHSPPILSELDLLLDCTRRLEELGLEYMLTGSMALNHYAQPRMTRYIVFALHLPDLETLPRIIGEDFYFSPDAAREAILHQSSFNVIHNESLIKIDFMIRKREDYRLVEFQRRQRVEISGQSIWIVSKEDLILSKLDWARESLSERQLSDVENLPATGADLDPFPLQKITWNATTQTVIYRSKHHYTTKRNFEIFKAPDFIAAALLHLPPQGLQCPAAFAALLDASPSCMDGPQGSQTVRYYGLYSNKSSGLNSPVPPSPSASSISHAAPTTLRHRQKG